MKIGILSQPLKHNYGGTLQNYALSFVLKSLGHNPYTINWGISNSWVKWTLRNLINILTNKPLTDSPYNINRQDEYFTIFHKKYINTTKCMGLISPRKVLNNDFDYIIVGSDQVWRKNYNSNIEYMYLSFVPDNIGFMSYAASIGIDKWDYPQDLTESCRKYISRFKAVTVREISAVKLLKDNLSVDSELVLDPTLLLTLQDYETNLSLKKRIDKPYVAVYLLDIDELKISLIKRIAKSLNIPINIIGNSNYYEDFKESKHSQFPSVESWLKGIRDAKFLITDSFHGAAFAINFHKQFVTLGNANRGNTRFDSLLGLFNLKNKFLESTEPAAIVAKELQSPIDWSSVDLIRSDLRQKSLNILKEQLK